jgi:hypothetical protein
MQRSDDTPLEEIIERISRRAQADERASPRPNPTPTSTPRQARIRVPPLPHDPTPSRPASGFTILNLARWLRLRGNQAALAGLLTLAAFLVLLMLLASLSNQEATGATSASDPPAPAPTAALQFVVTPHPTFTPTPQRALAFTPRATATPAPRPTATPAPQPTSTPIPTSTPTLIPTPTGNPIPIISPEADRLGFKDFQPSGNPWLVDFSTECLAPPCLRAGSIPSDGFSTLWLPKYDLPSNASHISFFVKNSSNGCCTLYFRILTKPEPVELDLTGKSSWTQIEVEIPGVRPIQFEWEYKNNSGNSSAGDTAWIDDIQFK